MLAKRLALGADGRRRGMQAPGCWDGLSALLVEQGGFEAAFVSGGGLAMARLGRPDVGLITAS
jgi:2-methylisocitrate lyase-like PEP mutase family enzyme